MRERGQAERSIAKQDMLIDRSATIGEVPHCHTAAVHGLDRKTLPSEVMRATARGTVCMCACACVRVCMHVCSAMKKWNSAVGMFSVYHFY